VVVQALKEIRETHTATAYNGVSYDTTANIVLNKLKEKATSAITHPVVVPAPIPAPVRVAPTPVAQVDITTSTLTFRKYDREERATMDLKDLLKVGNMFYNGHDYHKNHKVPYHSFWKITAITAKMITAVEYSEEWWSAPGATEWTRETLAPHIRPDLIGVGNRPITLDDVFGTPGSRTTLYTVKTLKRSVQQTPEHKNNKTTRSFLITSLCKCCFFHYDFPIEETRPFFKENRYDI
jgi:hypothetical protein